MEEHNRLTSNSSETDISTFLSSDSVFVIPFFQRPYKWKQKRLTQLNEDILTIVDQESGVHFLGAVIVHGRPSDPTDPKIYDVIDGQQRITTLFLYISAAVKKLAEYGEHVEAGSLFQKYLVISRNIKVPSNLKLHPCNEDRKQMNRVMEDLLTVKGLQKEVSTIKLKLFPSSEKPGGVLWDNYQIALEFFNDQYDQGGLDGIRIAYKSMLGSMSLVQIDVIDPTNGPKIFNSLNSRQEPMTTGDLVRNEIFSRVASEQPDRIEQIDQRYWQPFYRKFQEDGNNLFDSYFFPYGLVENPNIKKSDVYSDLRNKWRTIKEPKEIIAKLAIYQDAFLDISKGTNVQKHPKKVAALFNNLYRADAPSATYPFLMQLSRGVHTGRISEKDAIDTLKIIESFLVRRAVCGHEPTGLHAVFKRLWMDCKGKPNRVSVTAALKKPKTVVWPNDENIRMNISSRALYGTRILPYLLAEYDKSLGGDVPENIPWTEHVLPETPVSEWFDAFTKEQHHSMKDLLANLIPLSQEMNIEVRNRPYDEKKAIYKDDSMYKSARQIAKTYRSSSAISRHPN